MRLSIRKVSHNLIAPKPGGFHPAEGRLCLLLPKRYCFWHCPTNAPLLMAGICGYYLVLIIGKKDRIEGAWRVSYQPKTAAQFPLVAVTCIILTEN
jgi:hypothetical protein